MLIPESQTKVKSIKIPHWLFHLTACMCIVAFSTIGITKLQSDYFEKEFEKSNNKLLETEKEKEMIEDEKNMLESSFQIEKEKLLEESTEVSKEILVFEEKLQDLQEKIDEIDNIKDDIYDKMSVLEDKGAPVSLSSIASDIENSNGMGGPYIPLDNASSFQDILNLLEEKLDTEIYILNAYREAANNIEPFLLAYPTGLPMEGTLTSPFGERGDPFGGTGSEKHNGLDIAAPTGTPVSVTGAGVVEYAAEMSSYGYLVIVDHGYGYSTYYAHNSKLLVSKGDLVERGDTIALCGSTGRSTGSHVHYEVRVNDVPQNPANYIEL